MRLLQSFLSQDPTLKGALEPLAKLGNALHDLRVGGKPKMFFNTQHLTGGSKPTWDMGAITQGKFAAIAELLIAAGMTRTDARQWLVKQIAVFRLHDESGETIRVDRIFQNRDRYNRDHGPTDAQSGARSSFESLKRELIPLLAGNDKPRKVAWAKQVGEEIMRQLSLLANAAFPKTNKLKRPA